MKNNMNSTLGNPGEDPGDTNDAREIRGSTFDDAGTFQAKPELVEVDVIKHVMAQDIKSIQTHCQAGWRCVGTVVLMGQTSGFDIKPVPTQFMVFVGRAQITREAHDAAVAQIKREDHG